MGRLRKGEAFPQVRRQSRTWDIAPRAEKCRYSRGAHQGRPYNARGGRTAIASGLLILQHGVDVVLFQLVPPFQKLKFDQETESRDLSP